MIGPARRLSSSELNRYWSGLSDQYLEDDPDGLAVICYAGMPPWFNGFLNRYQERAFAALTKDLLLDGARVLDIGTGVGRWARWFASHGASDVVGIDIEQQRLSVAESRTAHRSVDFDRMDAAYLAFAPATFEVVNSVTVLQHVDRDTKLASIAEISRILRPGGHLVLFELTDVSDDAPHVFPESRESWLDLCRQHGLRPVRIVGEQYIPLIRLAKGVMRLKAGSRSRDQIDAFKGRGPGRRGIDPVGLALRFLVLLSYPIEELCQRLLPPSAGRITGFLLRKDERHTDISRREAA